LEKEKLKYKKHKNRILHFTIVEVTVAMLVLAILLTIVMQFFDSAQKGWSMSSSKSTVYENARIALGLINRQIQGVYYKNGVVPFYHKGADYDPLNQYSNDSISFVSYLDETPNPHCTSTASEIQYQLYYSSSVDEDTAGWMLLSITGNKEDVTGNTNTKWNFYNNSDIFAASDANFAYTEDNTSRDFYIKLIPYVTRLDFTCYDSDGSALSIENSTQPASIEVVLSIMDRASWNKWITMDGVNGSIYRVEGDNPTNTESTLAKAFRKKHEQTFTRTIYIGNRNQ
jgi:type II secretory pathway pseudopilin PulG